jgi:hypothetical protein
MIPRKRRVRSHIMEERSMMLIKELLPEEWVIHSYKPDYGVDAVIELFKFVDSRKQKADALGELIFAQVKSVKTVRPIKFKVTPRINVEKAALDPDLVGEHQIDVIAFDIETSLLSTVQAMGAGHPVLLFVAALDTCRVFFVCLNDLIDKVIIPTDPNFGKKEKKVVHIPIHNEITSTESSLDPLRFYAKRSKLYAAFSKFAYQKHELDYIVDSIEYLPAGHLAKSEHIRMIRHFINIIQRYDFWETTDAWSKIYNYYRHIQRLSALLDRIEVSGDVTKGDFPTERFPDEGFDSSDQKYARILLRDSILRMWDNLLSLNNCFEEICREWWLPTFLSQNLSTRPMIL